VRAPGTIAGAGLTRPDPGRLSERGVYPAGRAGGLPGRGVEPRRVGSRCRDRAGIVADDPSRRCPLSSTPGATGDPTGHGLAQGCGVAGAARVSRGGATNGCSRDAADVPGVDTEASYSQHAASVGRTSARNTSLTSLAGSDLRSSHQFSTRMDVEA